MYGIGPSSYPDLKGVEQVIQTERMAAQFWSVKVDFDAWMFSLGRTGRLSANEGFRSEERCIDLWNRRAELGIVVAPPLTSRHYRKPNAIDFGITEADGSNRALADDEFLMLHRLVELRGGTWTGVLFGEKWHHEMATVLEQLLPYPDARARAEAGPTPPPTSSPEEFEMIMFQVKGGGIFLAGPQFLTHYDDGAAAARDADRFKLKIETVDLVEGQRLLGVFHVPWNYADAKQFRKAAPTGQWDSRGAVKAV
jgi:hypothetical protein